MRFPGNSGEGIAMVETEKMAKNVAKMGKPRI